MTISGLLLIDHGQRDAQYDRAHDAVEQCLDHTFGESVGVFLHADLYTTGWPGSSGGIGQPSESDTARSSSASLGVTVRSAVTLKAHACTTR